MIYNECEIQLLITNMQNTAFTNVLGKCNFIRRWMNVIPELLSHKVDNVLREMYQIYLLINLIIFRRIDYWYCMSKDDHSQCGPSRRIQHLLQLNKWDTSTNSKCSIFSHHAEVIYVVVPFSLACVTVAYFFISSR